jgi:hypothetical protein
MESFLHSLSACRRFVTFLVTRLYIHLENVFQRYGKRRVFNSPRHFSTFSSLDQVLGNSLVSIYTA